MRLISNAWARSSFTSVLISKIPIMPHICYPSWVIFTGRLYTFIYPGKLILSNEPFIGGTDLFPQVLEVGVPFIIEYVISVNPL
jgi:hypothetical protein